MACGASPGGGNQSVPTGRSVESVSSTTGIASILSMGNCGGSAEEISRTGLSSMANLLKQAMKSCNQDVNTDPLLREGNTNIHIQIASRLDVHDLALATCRPQ